MFGVSIVTTQPVAAQSIEDRLRSQLRETTLQLRQLQDSQSQLQADSAAANQQRDKALADLKQAQQELAEAKQKSGAQSETERALASEKVRRSQDEQELEKYKASYAELQNVSRVRDTERTQSQTALKTQQTQLQNCQAKNEQLYQVGHEILDAYAHAGIVSVLQSREPFAERERVKYDSIAQAYGDSLYENKYDPRASPPSAASAAIESSAPAASK
ncbi:hypothetical protein [Pararobbsia silviterrae]|uniref:DNA repair protein n=1 Tax=Pararobbsia silviterrae TaxID=1792498 RepID=A0A494Y785_9BURK|nr:hypothetical protein [Pararobbsia silviterrae]RKP57932.1 hypothetical protein D7S86_07855 [Pararobbsia silviterrae]